MDIQFAGDVLAVGNDRVGGDTQHIGNLLVAQAANDLNEHIFFALGEFLRLRLEVASMREGTLSGERRTQDVILDGAMVGEILLGVPEVGHDADEEISDRGRVTGCG